MSIHNRCGRIVCLLLALLLLLPAGRVSHAVEEEIERSETVYVTADAEGAVQSVLSSIYLVNPDGREELSDASILSDVKNISSTEVPKQTDSGWTFKADGEDVSYQGTASADNLPIKMTVSYELDGKPMTAEQIAGKSGRVRVTVAFENQCKETVAIEEQAVELYTPFTVVTMIELGDDFKRTSVENAKLMSEAGSITVVGTHFPGLAHNLETDATDSLSESFWFEADVKAFSLESIMAIIVPDLLDADDLQTMDDVQEFTDGIDELNDGGEELMRGAKSLHSGMKKYTSGLESYLSGVSSLSDGANKLQAGLSAADTAGLQSALSSVGGDLQSAGNDIGAALGALGGMDMTGMTDAQIGAVQNAISALSGAAGELQSVEGTLSSVQAPDMSGLRDGVTELAGGLAQLDGNGDDILDGAVSIRKGMWSLYKGIRAFCDEGLKELDEQTDGLAVSVDRKDAMLELCEAYTAYSAENVTLGSVKFVITTDSIYVPKVEAPAASSETLPAGGAASAEDPQQDAQATLGDVFDRFGEFFGKLFGR